MDDKIKNNIATDSGRGIYKLSIIFKRQEIFLAILIVIISAIATLVSTRFLSIQNFFNIILSVSVIGIATVGLAMVIIIGEFDLSLGSMMSLQAVLFALLTRRLGPAVSIVFVILLGLVLGAFNGFLVTRIKAHSFIITLALLSAYSGAALLISDGRYQSMQGTFTIFKDKLWGIIPNPSIVFIVIIIIAGLTFRYLRFGRLLYAIGGNIQATYLSGVKVRNYKVTVFAIAGLLYSIAAIVLVSILGVALPTSGDPYMLSAFASAVVGGVLLGGGKGNALEIFLGVIVFGLIGNALVIMNVNPFWRDVVTGGIILIAITVSGFVEYREQINNKKKNLVKFLYK